MIHLRSCIDMAIFVALIPTVLMSEEARPAKVTKEYAVGSCHFRMTDYYGGLLDSWGESPPMLGYRAELNRKIQPTEIKWRMNCFDTTQPKWYEHAGIFARPEGNGWLADFTESGSPSPDPGQHYRFTPFHSNNWSGVYVTSDQIDGAEEDRTRVMSFCLVHDTRALCGWGDIRYLQQPKGDIQAKVLKLLQSIEFIDTSTSSPAHDTSVSKP